MTDPQEFSQRVVDRIAVITHSASIGPDTPIAALVLDSLSTAETILAIEDELGTAELDLATLEWLLSQFDDGATIGTVLAGIWEHERGG